MIQHDFTKTDDLLDAFMDHLLGRLDPKAVQALEQALLADHRAATLCKDLAETMVLTQEALQSKGAALQELKHVTGPDLLAELARRESQATAELVDLSKSTPLIQSSKTSGDAPLTFKQIAAASSYLIRHSFTPKLAATAGLAAALLLGVVLAIVMLTGPAQTDPGFADTTDKPAIPAQPEPDRPARNNTVATLTAEHHAQWAEGALVPGSTLKPGQHLTLTHGFAEITTVSGAIAILEAPTTIELLADGNAIKLGSGKITGICETIESQGLTVYTPQATIKDTGTRFGVMHEDGRTQMSVMKGSVIAKAADDADPHWIELVQGQHAAVSADSNEILLLDHMKTRFVYDLSALTNAPRLTGQARYKASMPASVIPGDLESDMPLVLAEWFGVELPVGFESTFVSPGQYNHRSPIDPTPLAKATKVDYYFVHFDLPGQPELPTRRIGTLHFDRPIVGVITLPDHLLASGELLDRPDVSYRLALVLEGAPAVEGLDITPTAADIIRISQDRKTLEFDISAGRFTDQFRVLVQAGTEVTR